MQHKYAGGLVSYYPFFRISHIKKIEIFDLEFGVQNESYLRLNICIFLLLIIKMYIFKNKTDMIGL